MTSNALYTRSLFESDFEIRFQSIRIEFRKTQKLLKLKIIMIIMINAIALKIASNWPIFTENILLCTILVTGMLPHGNSKCNSHSTN